MAALPSSVLSTGTPRLHATGEACPVCEQPIPEDRFEEIKERINLRQREQAAEITSRLQAQFAREKADAVAQARQEGASALAREREAASAREAVARREGQRAAELASQQTVNTLRAQIAQTQADSRAAVEKVKKEAAENETRIRRDARQVAEAAVQHQVSDMRRTHQESESALQARVTMAEQAKLNAITRASAAEQQVGALKETHTAEMAQLRGTLDQAVKNAVNAEKSAAFEKQLKMLSKVEELEKALDRKTAEELGEGAELDLYELLKSECPEDRVERINKGQPGADILHVVMYNGKECGTIIYDSKNHSAWRNEFVAKLAADQMAAKADHAILSTRKFPAGVRHLHVQDGVILASPSRVAALVQIVRQHLIQTHTLRLSNEARTQKTAALYGFITSERCSDLFARFDTHAEDLLDLQVKEKRAHDVTWKRQGELIRSVQKVRAELCNEIEAIIGTAGSREESSGD